MSYRIKTRFNFYTCHISVKEVCRKLKLKFAKVQFAKISALRVFVKTGFCFLLLLCLKMLIFVLFYISPRFCVSCIILYTLGRLGKILTSCGFCVCVLKFETFVFCSVQYCSTRSDWSWRKSLWCMRHFKTHLSLQPRRREERELNENNKHQTMDLLFCQKTKLNVVIGYCNHWNLIFCLAKRRFVYNWFGMDWRENLFVKCDTLCVKQHSTDLRLRSHGLLIRCWEMNIDNLRRLFPELSITWGKSWW